MENIALYQREHMVPSSGVKVSCIYFLCVVKGHKICVTSKTGNNRIKQHIQKLVINLITGTNFWRKSIISSPNRKKINIIIEFWIFEIV